MLILLSTGLYIDNLLLKYERVQVNDYTKTILQLRENNGELTNELNDKTKELNEIKSYIREKYYQS